MTEPFLWDWSFSDFEKNGGHVVLGGMTKNLYHGIFKIFTGFTVYDRVLFHAWPGVNHIFLREEILQ